MTQKELLGLCSEFDHMINVHQVDVIYHVHQAGVGGSCS